MKARKRFELKKVPMPSDIDVKEYYEKQLELYQSYEMELEKCQSKLVPKLFEFLNYGMTLNEMKDILKEKFKSLKAKGLILSIEEFRKVEDKYFSTPTKDLVRMWGADYLKKKIDELNLSHKYDVPEYIIVARDLNHFPLIYIFALISNTQHSF